jgi:hypothetical protein
VCHLNLAIFLVSFLGHSQTISKQVVALNEAIFENGTTKDLKHTNSYKIIKK